MYRFSYYLDKTFRDGISEQDALELKKLQRNGKSIKQYLNKQPTSIYIGATINGKYIKVRTDEKILPIHWDSVNQTVKPSLSNAFEFNADLTTLKSKVDLAYRNVRANNPNMSLNEVKELIRNVIKGVMPKANTKGFFGLWDEFVEEKKKSVKPITITKYGSTKTHLLDFHQNHYPITIEKINKQFAQDYNYYLNKHRKHLNNTVAKSIVNLKVFYRWAIEKGHANSLSFLSFKIKYDDTDIIYLTEAELVKLYNLDLKEYPKLIKVRDTFCFQCFTGQRFSDIKTLRWNDIKNIDGNWEWHLYQRKGNKSRKIVVPISHYGELILKKYPCMYPEANPIVLPVFTDQITNNYIKKICKLAEFDEYITIVKYRGKERIEMTKKKWELITTHCARRSFVTLSLEKKMRPEVVQSITGHEQYKVMQKYLKINDDVKRTEFKIAWDKFKI